ncbi:MAG: 4Fe-4S ferredoxin, partial [Alphaproteobacteria bacterium]|nr:4Fe-4S ferredoxin [Alphaproteobacteria bacterium]
MEINGRRILLCDCEHSMALDGKALAKACGAAAAPDIASHLCRAQIDNFRGEIARGGRVLVACTQEAPLFDEVAGEAGEGGAALGHVNIRERAGWSADGRHATAKIAALLAEAATDIPPTPTVTMASDGVCLVYGRDEVALEAARQLAG